VIEVESLVKSYGELKALGGVSVRVDPGETYGLLGHNGAGKSTFAKILTGLLRADEGRVLICGIDAAQDPLAARAKLGYLPEESVLYEELSASEHLALFADLRRVPRATAQARAERLLGFLDLAEAAERPVASYSRGMRRKTAIGVALIGDPEVVLFDEPTGGLDPDGARRFAEVLSELKRRQRTVIIQSHILGLVQKRCDRVGILDRGLLKAQGTVPELREAAGLPDADLEDLFLHLTEREARDAKGLLD
jgi:ABC-2 type transport system ATP-binding protein